MIKYEKVTIKDQEVIKRENADGTISWIPLDLGNLDYQEYLKSLNETPAL